MNIKEDEVKNSRSNPELNRSLSDKIVITIVEKNDTLNISDQMAFEYNNQISRNEKENNHIPTHNHSMISDSKEKILNCRF